MTAMPVRRFAADPAPLAVRSVARSHVGLVRAINEDRVFDCPDARIWAVADGMGGHAGGDLAAQAVVDRLRGLTGVDRTIVFTDLLVALGQANGDIRQRNDRLGTGAGATVVAAMIDDATARIAWAGDSRAYRVRGGRAELLTHDHSVVQELIDAGVIAAAAADRHPQAHVVTRALGVDDDPRLQTICVDLVPGDRLLLCSDGLSRSLDPAVGSAAIDPLADRLLARALASDGSDNISFVLIAWADPSA